MITNKSRQELCECLEEVLYPFEGSNFWDREANWNRARELVGTGAILTNKVDIYLDALGKGAMGDDTIAQLYFGVLFGVAELRSNTYEEFQEKALLESKAAADKARSAIQGFYTFLSEPIMDSVHKKIDAEYPSRRLCS